MRTISGFGYLRLVEKLLLRPYLLIIVIKVEQLERQIYPPKTHRCPRQLPSVEFDSRRTRFRVRMFCVRGPSERQLSWHELVIEEISNMFQRIVEKYGPRLEPFNGPQLPRGTG